ncbi:MAG: sulfatase [Halanaerobiales bacterium]
MEDRRERLVYKPTELPEEAYCDNWLSKNGLEMIDDFPVNNPWFLQVNFTGPHDPWDVTQEMRERWQDIDFPVPVEWSEEDKVEEIKKVRQNYAAMLENIDRNIGLYLDKLEERGELDNTIIIYSADHGEMLGDFNKWGKSSPQKGSVRVPLVISGPEIKDITENLYTDSLVELQDLTATILDYCGLEMPEAKDSTSLRPVLSGARKEHRKYQISELKNRKRNWKLVADNRYKLINYQDKKKNQLFDLETDPEQNNPIEDESVEKKMIAHLKRFI